jgi:sulfopyruvate decarboxylase TPP-binding subunit
MSAAPVARSVPSDAIIAELDRLGITHVVCIPDSFQKTVIAKLMEREHPHFFMVATEDEAMGVNAGLYAGGQNPMLLIQNNGIFASINTIKAICLDAKVPTFIFVGQFQRDVTKPVEENSSRAVRMLEPTLATWGVPYLRLEGPDDLPNIERAYRTAWETEGPAVLIVGAPTS